MLVSHVGLCFLCAEIMSKRGDSHNKRTGILVGNFKKNPEAPGSCFAGVA